MTRSRRIVREVTLAGLVVSLVIGTLLPGCAKPDKRTQDSVAPGALETPAPRYLRFSLTVTSETRGKDRAVTSTGSGWIDLQEGRLRVSTFDKGPKVRTELLIDRNVEKVSQRDVHGYGIDEETDSRGLRRPYDLIRPYVGEVASLTPQTTPQVVEGTETVRVALADASWPGWLYIDVRTSDGTPVRIVYRDERGTTTYAVECKAVESVPGGAFALKFPEGAWPSVTRRLTAAEAAAFDAYEVFSLGDEYAGLVRHESFYRTSPRQGSPNIRFSPDGWPLWSYTNFAREGVTTSYWKGGDDRWYETFESAPGLQGYRGRSPNIKVTSMAVRYVEDYVMLKGDPRDVRKDLRSALKSGGVVELFVERSADGPGRAALAKRIGDTLVVVEAEPDLAARAIEDVRLLAP